MTSGEPELHGNLIQRGIVFLNMVFTGSGGPREAELTRRGIWVAVPTSTDATSERRQMLARPRPAGPGKSRGTLRMGAAQGPGPLIRELQV